jgi:hypothetical protein
MSRGYSVVGPDGASANAVVPTSLWSTYTPIVSIVGAGVAPTYATNSCRYRLVNDIVNCDVMLVNTAGGTAGSGAGQLYISLPVVVGSAFSVHPILLGGYALNNATYWFLSGVIALQALTMPLTLWNANGGGNTLAPVVFTGANQNNAIREIHLHFWYEVQSLTP